MESNKLKCLPIPHLPFSPGYIAGEVRNKGTYAFLGKKVVVIESMLTIYNKKYECLSWKDTLERAELLGLATPKILYQGMWDETVIKPIGPELPQINSFVVRLADSFRLEDFNNSVARWVRKDCATPDDHWMHKAPNKKALKKVIEKSD